MTISVDSASTLYAGVLSRLDQLRERRPGYWSARCPAHDDRTPSLTVWVGRTGNLLARCLARQGCTFEEIVRAAGTEPADWFPPKGDTLRRPTTWRVQRVIEHAFDYDDEKGRLLFQAVRFKVAEGQPKRCAVRRPDGDGKWVWGLDKGYYARKADGDWGWHGRTAGDLLAAADKDRLREFPECRVVLYNLPLLLHADLVGRPLLVVEGEPDCHTLMRLDYLATTSPFGAGHWRVDFAGAFAGRRVVVIPDHDTPGYLHAWTVAGCALACGAASVRVVALPGVGEKGDVTDWLDRYCPDAPTQERRAALSRLIAGAVEWTGRTDPEVEAARRKHLDELGRRWRVPVDSASTPETS